MKLLFIGDVVGQQSCLVLAKFLPHFKHEKKIDLIIINGENSADGNGITPFSAKLLFECGADVITTGNHCFKRREAENLYEENDRIIRPFNLGNIAVGKGITTLDLGNFSIAVINLIGITYMMPADNPFKAVDELLSSKSITTNNIIVDFHAEASAEKKSMGYFLEGRVSAVLGTHTHVQTADEQILGGHTAYITDVGMSGVHDSVLGVEKEVIIERFLSYYPKKHIFATGDYYINAVILDLNEQNGTVKSIIRVKEKMN